MCESTPPPTSELRTMAGLVQRLAGNCVICGVELWLYLGETRTPLLHMKPCRERYYLALRAGGE